MTNPFITTLADYQVDPERGFLPAQDPLEQLSPAFAVWENIAANVPALLMTDQLRPALDNLTPLDTALLTDERQLQRAMLLLSVFGNAYVWAESPPATKIPRGVAIPWAQVAEQLGRPMIVAHASIVLNNWRRLDKTRPVALDNLDTLQLFLGGLDERWFYLTTVVIEAQGGPALQSMVTAYRAILNGQVEPLIESLDLISAAIQAIYAILLRIPEKCDPHIFYQRVRPFLTGWEAPGVIYEGVRDQPLPLSGGSAAQSSLIQALDAFLGVKHLSEKSRPFLLEMRHYMPPAHRRFVEALENGPSLPAFVLAHKESHPALVEAYNGCLHLLDQFRKKHLELTVRYILQQAPSAEAAKGTGGTSFVPFLSTARQETTGRMIE